MAVGKNITEKKGKGGNIIVPIVFRLHVGKNVKWEIGEWDENFGEKTNGGGYG